MVVGCSSRGQADRLCRPGTRLLVCMVLLAGAGCASIPRRNARLAGRYPARPAAPAAQAKNAAIPSEYQTYADRAFAASIPEAPVHYAQLLATGDDALLARIHLIRAATNSIDLQTFIWKDDPVTRVLFAEFLRAADRGVRVRLLVDALFPIAETRDIARMAEAHERVELCLYNPISKFARPSKLGFLESLAFRMRRTNRRMHSKTFIVDGRIAIIGGRNNEGKYYDRDPAFVFKDRDVTVMGPVVHTIQASFDEFWTHRKSVYAMQFPDIHREYLRVVNRPLPAPADRDRQVVGDLLELADAAALSEIRDSLAIVPVDSVTFVADSPSRRKRQLNFRHRMTRHYRQMVSSAQDRLVFQTPYLIYDRRQRRDLRRARGNNPDLRVVVSSNSLGAADHVHVYAISYKHRRAFLRKKGMHIYEFKPVPGDAEDFIAGYARLHRLADEWAGDLLPPEDSVPTDAPTPTVCLHAKTLVVDGEIALVGSHNFDPRSSYLNAECGLVITDPDFARRIERHVLRDTEPQNSWTVARVPTPKRSMPRLRQTLGSISSRMPFFDIVPQTYASLFAPREGQEALPPDHPDFYEAYRDIGQFPDVDDPGVLRKMHLIKSFGGWARPLL